MQLELQYNWKFIATGNCLKDKVAQISSAQLTLIQKIISNGLPNARDSRYYRFWGSVGCMQPYTGPTLPLHTSRLGHQVTQ